MGQGLKPDSEKARERASFAAWWWIGSTRRQRRAEDRCARMAVNGHANDGWVHVQIGDASPFRIRADFAIRRQNVDDCPSPAMIHPALFAATGSRQTRLKTWYDARAV